MNTTTTICSIDLKETGAVLTWSDGFSSFYHYVWLRDCCYCSSCGDGFSSNRFLHPSDVPLDVKPREFEQITPTSLKIIWHQGDHESHYDVDWLRRHSYDDDSRKSRFREIKTWRAEISSCLPSVHYQDACQTDSLRLSLYRHLLDFGFVVVRGGPDTENGIESAAGLIGEINDSAYGKFFDLSPKSKIKTAGNTMFPVPPHTDEAFRYDPPGINVLHCIRPANQGGESVLVDGFQLGERLRETAPDAFALLAQQPQPYYRVARENGIDQRARAPIFVLNENNAIVGFRYHPRASAPFDVPSDLFPKVYAANKSLCELMFDPKNQARFRLENGDAVLFDNQRVLHARAAFDDVERKLKICSVSRERFHEKFRLLAHKLGYVEESEQILTAGVAG